MQLRNEKHISLGDKRIQSNNNFGYQKHQMLVCVNDMDSWMVDLSLILGHHMSFHFSILLSVTFQAHKCPDF